MIYIFEIPLIFYFTFVSIFKIKSEQLLKIGDAAFLLGFTTQTLGK
jgi:hypothetical protein